MQTDVINSLVHAFETANNPQAPYPHWLLENVLPADVAAQVTALPITAAKGLNYGGTREINNTSRVHVTPESRTQHTAFDALGGAFLDPKVLATIQATCGITLVDSFLRIEYCQDTDGFWLEPHTDISVKRFTMLIYLSQGPEAHTWGTDIHDVDGTWLGNAPSPYNSGLIFIPGQNTWHSFRKRPINGVRKTLMINFVGADWRAREELVSQQAVA